MVNEVFYKVRYQFIDKAGRERVYFKDFTNKLESQKFFVRRSERGDVVDWYRWERNKDSICVNVDRLGSSFEKKRIYNFNLL